MTIPRIPAGPRRRKVLTYLAAGLLLPAVAAVMEAVAEAEKGAAGDLK